MASRAGIPSVPQPLSQSLCMPDWWAFPWLPTQPGLEAAAAVQCQDHSETDRSGHHRTSRWSDGEVGAAAQPGAEFVMSLFGTRSGFVSSSRATPHAPLTRSSIVVWLRRPSGWLSLAPFFSSLLLVSPASPLGFVSESPCTLSPVSHARFGRVLEGRQLIKFGPPPPPLLPLPRERALRFSLRSTESVYSIWHLFHPRVLYTRTLPFVLLALRSQTRFLCSSVSDLALL